jgi:hypothetical protein
MAHGRPAQDAGRRTLYRGHHRSISPRLGRTDMIVLRFTLLFVISNIVGGCGGLIPGSQPYRPLPQWEAQFFKQAHRDIFPEQVRQQPGAYRDSLVAWTGIIVSVEYQGEGASRTARITAEHRYFDWIEDSGIQHEKYFLSPRGEGRFATYWDVANPSDQKFIDQFSVGDMLVAYGHPSLVQQDFIGLSPTLNMRAIKPVLFRSDALDYGKPGEPATLLKTPL